MNNLLVAIAASLSLFALLFAWLLLRQLRKKRFLKATREFVLFTLFAALAALGFTLQMSILGYQALTHEELAARIEITPRPIEKQFEARVVFPDGRSQKYLLAGDELYVDAHILKWHGWINLLGIHTMYDLDRIGGRYYQLGDEQSQPRTLHSLSEEKTIDVFVARRENDFLAPFVDAEYGSASFVPADRVVHYDLMVSTTGLLLRPTIIGAKR